MLPSHALSFSPRTASILVLTLASLAASAWAGVPLEFGLQGVLSSTGGTPHTSPVSVDLTLFTTDTGGSVLLQESSVLVPDSKGVFTTIFGDTATIVPETHLDQRLFFEVDILGDGQPALSPRLPVVPAPMALRAAYAEQAASALGFITASEQEATLVSLSTSEAVLLSATVPSDGAYLVVAVFGDNSFNRSSPSNNPFVDYRVTVNGTLINNAGTRRSYVDGASSQVILTDADLQEGDNVELRGVVEFASTSSHQVIGGRYLLLLRYGTP